MRANQAVQAARNARAASTAGQRRAEPGYSAGAENARAEVIDLTEERSSREVYDQYVDAGLRAVGD